MRNIMAVRAIGDERRIERGRAVAFADFGRHAASGVSASRRRTSANAVSVAGSAEITGTASTITSIGSLDSTIAWVALLAVISDTARSTAGSEIGRASCRERV